MANKKKKKDSSLPVYIVLIVILAAAVAAAFFLLQDPAEYNEVKDATRTEYQQFTVEPGSSAKRISQKLYDEGLIPNAKKFLKKAQ